MSGLLIVMNLQHDRSAWLHGPPSVCQVQPVHPVQCRRLVLLGAPGVGKGTQAALLSATFGSCHLSTGDVFRTARQCGRENSSPAMKDALVRMNRGELVTDETVLEIIRERTTCLACRGGFVLDGFPRTVPQADVLDAHLGYEGVVLDAIISYELPLAELITRIGGRRTCPVCKAVYHVDSRPARTAGACDTCGSKLIVREDDQPDAVLVRQEAYQRNTAPLLEYYAQRKLLVHVDAHGTPEEVFARTITALGDKR